MTRNAARCWSAAVTAAVLCLLSTAALSFTEATPYSFCSATHCSDGFGPEAALATDQIGNLYGTTYGGGHGYNSQSLGDGIVFEFLPSTGEYSVIYRFCSKSSCTDGLRPENVKVVVDVAGNIYGTTSAGGSNDGGVVFELVPTGSQWREKILYSFCAKKHCKDGNGPAAGLTYSGAAAGLPYDGTSPLYGTTQGGGANSGGTVFALMPKTGTRKWTETVLYSFCAQVGCADGAEPGAPLLIDASGDVYGTTEFGGQANSGTIYELSPSGTEFVATTLYNFCTQMNCADGDNARGGVVMDTSGNLLGSAGGGGSSTHGLLFELSPNGGQWQYNVLADFDGSNGSGPEGTLIIDSDGNLFGTTFFGGAQKKGTVFEFNGTIQTLYSFCPDKDCPDGKEPIAGVIEDSSGNLYGLASAGANHNSGTIFELSPSRVGNYWLR